LIARIRQLTGVSVLLALATATSAQQQIKLLRQEQDPYGFPRPGPGQQHVPLATTFFLEVGLAPATASDTLLADSVTIALKRDNDPPTEIVSSGQHFAAGYTGRIFPVTGGTSASTLAVYVDPQEPLRPATTYTVSVTVRSRGGAVLEGPEGTWRFTTEATPLEERLAFSLNLASAPLRWHGAFFSGFCKPSFCTSDPILLPTYELLDEVHRHYPRAWSLQRDFSLTGMDDRPAFLTLNLPNIVRERETRRISAIDERADSVLLRLEEFFGHEQYGIVPDESRKLSTDYHAGDEVLIADGIHSAEAKVLAADDQAGTVLVNRFATPEGGWKLDYAAPLPRQEDPAAPGRFPPGGCYLRKLRPSGTPCYYWDRLDHEWDLAHRRYGRRLMPNFTNAPGDLALDGRNWTTAKDYAELHEVTRAITSHLIERYGDACQSFVWSVFNEPDLGALFWRADWNELQKFYDYTVDGILRAFEDHGYDSSRVFVGGLELGAIFGTNLKLREFLTHCSPRAQGAGALPKNAAFADARLDGKRSKRVEELCRAHDGQGAPCDFVSIHAYNRSAVMAAKLARAKELALEIDAVYYERLWANSHESCPNWAPPPDPAATDSYLGNGYFETWCADVARRQLARAAADARYAYGETILTFWPWPNHNFGGADNCTRQINVDIDGDGGTDRTVTIAMPILHFLGLLASMDDQYWPLPEQTAGGHVVSGFAARTSRDLRVLLYAHQALDTQSRSDRSFDIHLDLAGLPWPQVRVMEYRFDRDHNSYYRLAVELRARPTSRPTASPEEVQAAVQDLGSADRAVRLAALEKLARSGSAAQPAVQAVLKIWDESADEELRAAISQTLQALISGTECYAAADVERVRELSALHTTATTTHDAGDAGRLRLTVRLEGNGADFLVIEPVPAPPPAPGLQ
jgi:hypothetical protein